MKDQRTEKGHMPPRNIVDIGWNIKKDEDKLSLTWSIIPSWGKENYTRIDDELAQKIKSKEITIEEALKKATES